MRPMDYWRAIFASILVFWAMTALGQEKQVQEIELVHANRLLVDKNTPDGATKLIGNVQLKQEGVLMFCDSAYLFDNNSLKAYGHVRIVEGDSLTLLGDSLDYNGNTKFAKVRGNVKVDNKSSVLTTKYLDYDRMKGTAYYYSGGTIEGIQEGTTLTSIRGYYYPEGKIFHFKDSVVLKHPDYTIYTDTMHYNPDLEKTWFFGPTDIISEKEKIYCEAGWFDQLNNLAEFRQEAVIHSSGQSLWGDTIRYDEAAKIGRAFCNVMILDTNEKFEVTGDYAIHYEEDSVSMVTLRMQLAQEMSGDSFYLHADTMYARFDTAGHRQIETFHHVKFFKSDMQGKCDSLVYSTGDSIIYMFEKPVLWSDENQITADSIRILMKNEEIDRMFMDENAFIVSHQDSLYYNQIKGRNMIGYFKDAELDLVRVFGNGETVYYPEEEDGTMIGVNKTVCSNMSIRIDSSKIRSITFYDNPVAVLTPSDDMPAEGIRLSDFQWLDHIRPKTRTDIFIRSEGSQQEGPEDGISRRRNRSRETGTE